MSEVERGYSGADLTNCDREPIHVPGAIQPHGFLLAFAPPSLAIAQVSENASVALGLRVEELLGRSLDEVLDRDSVGDIAAALAKHRWREANPLRVAARGTTYDGIVHEHDGIGILELEPAGAERSGSLRPTLMALQDSHALEDLCASAVHEVKRLTGFDRVMLYRFDEAGHGSVEAEAKESHLEPLLGLHYPASDIPRQARALYLKNWLRIIPDARYEPVRIVPEMRPDTGAPLDLSFSVLRSVSPIHLEYLANMGVRASMSLSLIVRGRLWGLICAHHAGPRLVPYELRAAAEVLARLASLQIEALSDRRAAQLRLERRGSHGALARAMQEGPRDEDVLESLLSRGGELLRLVGATGVTVLVGPASSSHGRCPERPLISEIAAWLDEHAGPGTFATSALPLALPAASRARDVASGVLTVTLPGQPRRRLLWFRPEIVRTVTWAGDPREPHVPDATTRLHPRNSFALWKEDVKLTSLPWSESDVEAAEELRRDAIELDLERQVSREQRAVRARDDVMAIVSHDLRSPLSVIKLQSALLARGASTAGGGVERIERAADAMSRLIDDLLVSTKIDAGRFTVDPRPERAGLLVEDALALARPLASARSVSIVEELLYEGLVRVDRERARQVFSNLLGNALKYTPEGGTIRLRVARDGALVTFTVTDAGPGIEPELLPHVFERYRQGRAGTGTGIGLGLHIAKGIVEAHGGTIRAERPEDGGARLSFTLPAA